MMRVPGGVGCVGAIAMAWLFVASTGCDDGDATSGEVADAGTAAVGLQVGTWNVGLAPGFVDYATERAPLISAALAESELDILCLQEVYEEADWQALTTATSANYPSAARLEPDQAFREEPACRADEIMPIRVCVEPACDGVADDQLASCALSNCEAEINAASDDCQGCLGANVGQSLQGIVDACGESTAPKPVYTYDGSFGVALLSRTPPDHTETWVLDSTLVRRGVVYARWDRAGADPLHVFCTHLTATLSTFEYTGPADSWGAEQAEQITAMRDYVESKARGNEPVVLLGDFNCSPDGGDRFAADLPENYAALADGYANVWIDGGDAACTYCFDNPLVGGLDHTNSAALDHVLARNLTASAPARIFDAPITLDVGEAAPIESRLSDHYGVRVRVGWPASVD